MVDHWSFRLIKGPFPPALSDKSAAGFSFLFDADGFIKGSSAVIQQWSVSYHAVVESQVVNGHLD